MRLPRVRFTVQRMIFAVGVVGTVIGTGQMISRWNYCARRALECDRLAKDYRKGAEVSDQDRIDTPFRYTRLDMKIALARYYEDCSKTYREAAWHPWRSLPRFSPPPDWRPDRVYSLDEDD